MKSLSTLFGKRISLCTILLPSAIFLSIIQTQAQNPLTLECPGAVTVDCTMDTYDPDNVGEVLVTGGCNPESVFMFPDDIEIASGCTYILERTYFAVDECGENASCSQIITVVDDIPLTLICKPDFTLPNCNAPTTPQMTGGLPFITDNCSEPSLTWSDFIEGNPEHCCEPYTIVRTWLAFDQCGTPATCEQLIFVPGLDCDDGDPCTDDSCLDGVCVNTPRVCDDGDPCTIDECVNGECTFTPVRCDDGDPCTDDICVDGVCMFIPRVCDDGDPCTIDQCIDGNCVSTPIICDDGDPCTVDACVNGVCIFTPVVCDDGDPCTTDLCDASGNCISIPIVCDDGDPCTNDYCVNGTCVFEPIVCPPSDPCVNVVCENGVCIEVPIVCDDGDPCTEDSCVDGVCVFTPISCDDGDPNTIDICVDGICTHTLIDCDDNDPCTDDYLVDGVCHNDPVVCDDGDPCTIDYCEDGVCVHEAIVCESSNPCMTSICLDGICVEIPIACDDGDPCTIDECVNGACVFTPINCDDGNPQTMDECIDGVCVNTLISCDDGNPCTLDAFVNGVCTHTPMNCDDGDPCTTDLCVNGVCVHEIIAGCGSEPPVAICEYSTYVFIDLLNPDYDGPFLNNVYLQDAEHFDDGSLSDSDHPVMEVKRNVNYISFDWTTQGACIDVVKNNIKNDPDKGKVFRSCLPSTPYDVFQWKQYRFRISDEYGSDECSGYYMVIPYLNWDFKQVPVSQIFSDGHIQSMLEAPTDWAQEESIEVGETQLQDITMFPNPGDGEVYFTWYSQYREEINITIRDITGKIVGGNTATATPGKNILRVGTEDLFSGSYIVQFSSVDRFHAEIWIKAEK